MTKIDVDSHKFMYHPERVSKWKKNGDCFPVYIEIGPTNRCNHRCMFCALDWLEHGGADLDINILCKNLKNMAQHGVKSLMFAGEGEPLLHKDIGIMVKTAKESGMDISITSNGVLLDQRKAEALLPYLSWIRFSVDAGTSKTYSEIHNCREKDYEKVMENIRVAAEIKKARNYSVTIGVQALLTSKSINELEELAMRVKKIGADNLQIKPYSHHPASKNDLSFDYNEAEKIRSKLEAVSGDGFEVKYRANTIARLHEERSYKQCHGLPFFSLIDARGNVIPCNLFYGNADFIYGNINEKLFSEIWGSERRKGIINKIHSMGVEKCRTGCRLDAGNKYLDKVKKDLIIIEESKGEKPPHANFI